MSEPDTTQNSADGEAAPSEPSAPGEAAPAEPTPEERYASALAEVAKLRDQLLRTAADFDNFRKRTRREIDDAHKRGKETTVKDLLPVFDNFERAITHAEGTGDAKAVADGLRIVLKQFLDTLEKMGVQRINAVGQPFDPSLHEAIQHMESADHPAGVVLYDVQPGYRMGDHLVRAAMVVVSKGAPAGSSAAN
ncbi:MAG: nucleotide exchange factor GrpE [Polyangiaceae bacterium]|nr:nucleotide exchange factor GrpE [Polyangiaceae bacterium]